MIEPEKLQLNINKPYYQNLIPMINESQTKQNQVKTIRLFSATNPNQKNKKYESQEKLKIYKDNSISNNFKSNRNRPTSVKQSHQNYFYPQKRKIIYNSEMNYPQLTLNSTNIQGNNVPLQRRRKIVYEEDNELADEYDILRKIWKEAGVTDTYIDNFETITNNEKNSKSEILQSLKNEEQQMIKFKEEMLKVVSEIIKRENDIKNIKNINKRYLNVKTRISVNINPKKNIKNNNYIKEKDKKKNEENENNEKDNELKKELEEEKNKIEQEIERCLTSLRLHGINVVTVMKKFNMRYENLLNAGKVDLDYLKKKYGFDKNYLLKLKTDLDFLKDSDIGDLYHFSQKGKDPFLISISIDEQKDNVDKTYKYKILPISEDMAKQIKLYNHLLNEIEIFTMMKNDYSISNNNISNNFSQYKYGGFFNGISKNNDSSYFFDSKFKTVNNLTNITPLIKESKITFNTIQSKQKMQNKKSDFQGNFKSIRLVEYKKSQNQIEKLKKNLAGPYISKVDNSSEANDNNYNNNNYNSKTIQMPKIKINKTKSILDEESISSNPDDEIVKEVQTRVNKEVINKLFEVENRVKKQVEEKLKKDQERIEEEERRLKKEKEKIEELRKIEEEKRKKDKEKWEKIEKERIKREIEEKKKFEEEEKLKKEENEQFRKDIEQKFLNEIEKRFKKEENERKRREEENNLIKKELELKIKYELEQERIKREREEREKAEMKEKIRLEEIEKIKNAVRKDEYDRIRRQEIDKIDKEREERKKREEFERKRKEEEERMKREIERLKKENEERKEKANDDKKRREEEEKERKEREKKLYEEIERLKKEELIKKNLEKEIELQKKIAEEKELQYKKELEERKKKEKRSKSKENEKKEKRSKSKEKEKKGKKSKEKDKSEGKDRGNSREKSREKSREENRDKSRGKSRSKSKEKKDKKQKKDGGDENKNIIKNTSSMKDSSVSVSEKKPNKKRQITKGISSSEDNNIYTNKESSSNVEKKKKIVLKNKNKHNDDDKNEESEIPSSSKEELRFVDIKNIKGSKLEIDASDVKSFEKSKIYNQNKKKNYKLKTSYNAFKPNLLNSFNNKLAISRMSQMSSSKNKKAKKAPMKAVDEIFRIKDSKIIFTNPNNSPKDKESQKFIIEEINSETDKENIINPYINYKLNDNKNENIVESKRYDIEKNINEKDIIYNSLNNNINDNENTNINILENINDKENIDIKKPNKLLISKILVHDEIKEEPEKEELKSKYNESKISGGGNNEMNVKEVIIEGVKEVFNNEVKMAIKEEVGKALAEVKKSFEINREKEREKYKEE